MGGVPPHIPPSPMPGMPPTSLQSQPQSNLPIGYHQMMDDRMITQYTPG